MANTQLPPQAYTREDVAKAFVWVQSQPDYVKNMATGKETLVALYLAARRNGDSSLENIAPVSSKDFKNQLQSLASELGQFEKSKETLKPLAPTPQETRPTEPKYTEMVFEPTIKHAVNIPTPEIEQSPNGVQAAAATAAPSNPKVFLDERSQRIVDTVKANLNLESEKEVVRMLLVLGFEKIKAVFPNKD